MQREDRPEFYEAYSILCNEGLSPLTTITGYAQLALQGAFGALTPEHFNALTVIVKQSKQAMQTWRQGLDYLRATYDDITLLWQPFTNLTEYIETEVQPGIPSLELVNTVESGITIHCDLFLLGIAISHLLQPMELVHNHTSQWVSRISFRPTANATIDCQIQSLTKPEITPEHLDHLVQLPGSCLNVAKRIINKHNSTLIMQCRSEGINMQFTLQTQ